MDQPHYWDADSKEEHKRVPSEIAIPYQQPQNRVEKKKSVKGAVLLFLILIAWHFTVRLPIGTQKHDRGTAFENVDFDQIKPSERLEWHPCRGGFYCARLTVPMDYNRPLNASKDNPKVYLALLLVPGKHHNLQNSSVSPLLVNPGGPGGSGVFFAQYAAGKLQAIVDPEQDVIGFDPRGIGATTPRLDCWSPPLQNLSGLDPYDFGTTDFADGFWKRLLWTLTGREAGFVNTTAASLSQLNIRVKGLTSMCHEKDEIYRDNGIFRHTSTPNVARDMISIVDAWDEWRASSLVESVSASEIAQEKNAQGYAIDTKGKLVYWGFSYGTLLGATFAALFPDRVGRVILDGVVDADHYVEPVWTNSLVDADKIFESFPMYCFEGGNNCPLYRVGDTQKDVSDRFYDGLENLREKPLTFLSTFDHIPIVLRYDDIKVFAFSALYDPNHNGFNILAYILDVVVRRDLVVLSSIFRVPTKEIFQQTLPEWFYPGDAQMGIMCADKRYLLSETVPELQHRFDEMSKLSQFTDIWFSLLMQCNHYDVPQIDPPLRWGRHPVHKEKPINTSFPLLYLSNTLDPVTPLRAAVKMALKFKDAGLVEQESMGHCTLAATSFCTIKRIREYLRQGKVPRAPVPGKKKGTGNWERCEAVEKPFQAKRDTVRLAAFSEESKIAEAAKELQDILMKYHTSHLDSRFRATPFGALGHLRKERVREL